MNFLKSKKILIGAILFVISIGVIALFDTALAVGIVLLAFLTAGTFFVISKMRKGSRELFSLFLIALAIHGGAVVFIYYADFQPFSGGTGDYTRYQESAVEIAQRIREGNLSFEGVWVPHLLPVLLGFIYALSLPSMLIGQLFNAWVAALAVLFLYLLIRELGVSSRWAFISGLAASIYPSHVFFSSLLLKDAITVTLAVLGAYAMIRILKKFSWPEFIVFVGVLLAIVHFRFYIGFILEGSFLVSWFLFSKFDLKKRLVYAIPIVFILGFVPQVFGYGYYGIETRSYLAPERIAFYKETVYQPIVVTPPPEVIPPKEIIPPSEVTPSIEVIPPKEIIPPSEVTPPPEVVLPPEVIGSGSSFNADAGFEDPVSFVWNNGLSFVYSVFGPFPWQFRYSRQALSLFETIPWYIVFVFVLGGIWYSIRKKREALSLLIFSIGVFGAVALFFSNYGIITRIRMPAFLALLPFMAVYLDSRSRMEGVVASHENRGNRPPSAPRIFFGIWLYYIILYLRIRARAWFIFFMINHKKERWFQRKINGNIMWLDATDKGISRELLYSGKRECRSTDFLQTFLKTGEICVDIGANIGYYALQEARLVGDSGKIFAIEPSRDNIELLKKNIEANRYKNITVYRSAVGSENRTGEINLSRSSNQHSFLTLDKNFSGKTEKVEIITLDTFLKDKPYPHFVRMDVEGYEKDVIIGMKGVLNHQKPLKIFMELHTPSLSDTGLGILTTLRDAGFIIGAVFKERYSMLEREPKPIVSLYDFVFSKRFYLFNDSFESYDVEIDDLIKHAPKLKENVFEVFFERK